MSPAASVRPIGLQRIGREPVPGAALLEVDDLHTAFRLRNGLVRAVDGVSFKLQRGQTLGVVGESGSGKTVLSRSVMGILTASNVETQGEVRYEGHDLEKLGVKDRRALWGTEMAMVFQDPMTSLNPVMRIGRQITESLRYHLGMSKQEAKEAAIAGLASVGIPAPERRYSEYPHQLSGGMRQRVTIAIALACGPKLMFADEPTTALDVTVQAQILALLDALKQETGTAVLLITHDLGVVAGRADHVAVMYAGQIVEMAATADLFADVRMPYTQALLRSIPKLDEASHTRLNVIGGRPPDLINPPKGCRFAPRCPYAQDKCLKEAPPLTESGTPGHLYRCWFPVGSPTVKTTPAPISTNGQPKPGAAKPPAAPTASDSAPTSPIPPPAAPRPAPAPASTPEEN